LARDDDVWSRLKAKQFVSFRSPWSSPADAARSGPTVLQLSLALLLTMMSSLIGALAPRLALAALHLVFLCAFTLAVLWRGVATAIAKPPPRVWRCDDDALPAYTVIIPLYREAAMVPGLLAALEALDYPSARLQILFALEAGDEDTRTALSRARTQTASPPFEIMVMPSGAPRTKPRACTLALMRATGEHVVVYDAEDRPHPLQLREAAARFAEGDERLACLQAPLRITGAQGFFARQFALEYAAQFEIGLPALAQVGLPFPLGGTSNHFRTTVLRDLGGWDAWNVTEDADLGFRLPAEGFSIAMLRSPTWESAPTRLKDWLPQRARWVKGFMQTWGVHTRAPFKGGFRRALALQATLGLAILSAFAHGPVFLILIADALFALCRGRTPTIHALDFALLVSGWGGAILAMSAGAKRAGLRMSLADAALAPVYWALQTVAALQAAVQLCTRPYHWDKTHHEPAAGLRIGGGLDEAREASVRRAA